MKNIFAAFILAIMLAALAGCKNSPTSATPVDVQLNLLQAPMSLQANADRWYTYFVQVQGDGFRGDSVVCEVHGPSGQQIPSFTLYDDGDQDTLSQPSYASTTSGDILAGNGTFSRSINSERLAAGTAGTYSFHFVIYGKATTSGNVTVQGADLSVQLANVNPVEFLSWPNDTVFTECFAPIMQEIHLRRSPADRVDSVAVELRVDGQRISRANFAPVSGDTVWQFSMNPSMFPCVESFDGGLGAHVLFYHAYSQYYGTIVDRLVWNYAHHAPSLTNLVMPDTVIRPLTGADTILTTVKLVDCELEGFTRYYGVKFSVRWDDTLTWTESDSFYLRDDGVLPDLAGGDETYTVGLQITPGGSHPSGILNFRFFALDCVSPFDTSAFLYDAVQVIQEGSLAASESSSPGFSVVRR